jgi:mRNA interferase MazF
MGKFVKGDVVVIPFPFTDLSGSKKRPAFVVADLSGDDIIVCQITSKSKSDPLALPLAARDFSSGGLPVRVYMVLLLCAAEDNRAVISLRTIAPII